MSHSHPRQGFTLVELLVVILIIVLLIGLTLPAVRRVDKAAERMRCHNNIKNLILALHNYHDNQGAIRDGSKSAEHFPTGCVGPGNVPEERLSWLVSLLPYIEQEDLYRQIDLKQSYAANASMAATPIPILTCPSLDKIKPKSDALTSYLTMAGVGLDAATRPAGAPDNGFMGFDRKTTLDMITDGTSNTLAILETRSQLGPWARGGNSNLRGYDPGVPVFGDDQQFAGHPNGINAVFADGSVRFLRLTIAPKILAAAITIAGNEKFELD